MSTPISPKQVTGTKLSPICEGSTQQPFKPFSNTRAVCVATAVLDATYTLSPGFRPGDYNLDGGDGSRSGKFGFDPMSPLALLGLKFALGHASDPNDLMAMWRLLGHTAIEHGGKVQWVTEVLADGYVVAGNVAVHAATLLAPEDNTLVFKWVDTIVVSNDYTLGDSCRVQHEAANGAATLWLDSCSHGLVQLEITCRSDGSHGTACSAATGCWRQM